MAHHAGGRSFRLTAFGVVLLFVSLGAGDLTTVRSFAQSSVHRSAATNLPPGVYFFDDMSGDTSGWVVEPPWQLASQAWHFSSSSGQARLMSPPINLQSAVHPMLRVWYAAIYEDGLPTVGALVTLDNGATSHFVRGYPPSSGTVDTVDISAYAGAPSLRLVFLASPPGEHTIFFLDDVTVMEPPPPGGFAKSAPVNGATVQDVTLQWAGAGDATSYEYCVDTTNNNTCDGTWTSTGTSTSASVHGLARNTAHWWQVRARNDSGTTEADAGTWWTFTTSGAPTTFGKSAPGNGAIDQTASPTLTWTSSAGADSYEYCIDPTNNNACDGAWTSTADTSAVASGLSGATTYWWQVRARNTAGTTEADSGTWWSLTTGPLPGSFSKIAPASGTAQQTLAPHASWTASAGATSYEYCVDTTNDNTCAGTWTSLAGTSTGLGGLTSGTNWWQVRARNQFGTTDADAGTWWSIRGSTKNDFDGDGKTDEAIFRASTGGWHMLQSSTNNTTSVGVSWGLSTDQPMPGDYDGDGKTDPAIFRPSTGLWAILKSSTHYTTSTTVSWGLSTDLPVPADYDGDGKTDPAIYRPSTGLWALLKSSTGYTSATYVFWGLSTDVPMQADYDGDGKADPAVFRPSTGGWYVLKSSTNYGTSFGVVWGMSGDVPVPGDYDGDGKIDPAVFRPSTGGWFILQSHTNYMTSVTTIWGASGDVPAPGDFDGNGTTDFVVFTPSSGVWSVMPAEADLAHRWRLDEASGTVAIDAFGDGTTNGALGPGAQRISGHVGPGALLFNEGDLDGYVNIPGLVATFGTSDFTISFWMIKAPNPTFGALAGTRAGFDGHGNFVELYGNNSFVTLVIDEDTSLRGFIRLDGGSTSVSDGQWHRITSVRAGPTAWLYVDGALEATGTAADGVTANLTTGFDFTVGVNDWERAHPGMRCGCRFDDVRIYNRALSARDVQSSASEVSVSWGLSTDVPIGRRP